MRHPLSTRGAALGDFGVGMAAALGGRPRRAHIDAIGARRWPAAGAVLDLDFVNRQAYVFGRGLGKPEDFATVAGGAGGMIVAPSGVLVAGAAARYDFDPITLACKGLLFEEQKTNLLLQSSGFSTASWVRSAIVVTAAASTSPDGALTGQKIVPANGVAIGNSYVSQAITKAASATTYTYSVFALPAGFNRITLLAADSAAPAANRATVTISLVDGSVITAAASLGTFSAVSVAPPQLVGGWYRVLLTFTTGTETGLSLFILPYDSVAGVGDAVNGIYAWGAQLETGPAGTSLNPTGAAAVTRTADSAVISGATLADLYGSSDGYTVLIQFLKNLPVGIAAGGLMELVTQTTAVVRMGTNGDGTEFSYINDGANFRQPSGFPANAGGKFAISLVPKTGDLNSAYNGVASTAVGGPLVPLLAPTQLKLASNNANGPLRCGWLQRALVLPRGLSVDELKRLTAP